MLLMNATKCIVPPNVLFWRATKCLVVVLKAKCERIRPRFGRGHYLFKFPGVTLSYQLGIQMWRLNDSWSFARLVFERLRLRNKSTWTYLSS